MSRSRLSASRTSPTTMRSGRMRSASLTRRRRGISPVPSRLGCRHCSATTSLLARLSSNTSSAVMMRCCAGIEPASALSMVVLPACVAPETRIFRPARTHASRSPAGWGVSEPDRTRSPRLAARMTNLRMFTAMWRRVTSGMTTCRRSPPGSDASTNGLERSRRRPEDLSICSTRCSTCSSVRIVEVSSARPLRATNTCDGLLIQISSIEGSSRYFCSGPSPATASMTLFAALRVSTIAGTAPLIERES